VFIRGQEMTLSPENRIAGVLVPLFAVPGETDLGIGEDWQIKKG
jgi:hypothetical protein